MRKVLDFQSWIPQREKSNREQGEEEPEVGWERLCPGVRRTWGGGSASFPQTQFRVFRRQRWTPGRRTGNACILSLWVWTPPPLRSGSPSLSPAPARSERGREGTMSRALGMCPQRLFTNTELFMIAGKRNPTRAQSCPDLTGGRAEPGSRNRGEKGSFPNPLRARQSCAQGAARRGWSARLGLRPRRLCLRGAKGLHPRPCRGLKGL